MKSIKYLLVSLLFLFSVNDIFACWSASYSPAGYRMYRVASPTNETDTDHKLPTNKENCTEWQKLTSQHIPIKDIEQVVYKISLEEFEDIYNNRDKKYENKFAEWITKRDTAILEFLLLAKTTEYIREKMTSPWYYPTMKFNARMSIEEIAEKAISAKDKRLRKRYLLQGIRALISLNQYQEIIDIWDNEISKLPKTDIVRRLSEQYYIGALFNISHSDKAIEFFAKNGDMQSLLYCTNKMGKNLSPTEAISFVCHHAPNNDSLPSLLEDIVREYEPWDSGNKYKQFVETEDSKALYNLCIKMGANSKVKNQAMWYYTAAFLADLNNDLQSASKYIGLAEKSKSTKFIDESVYALRIYIDAKTSTYDSNYERKLFKQLKWLDKKIGQNITDKVREDTRLGYKLINGYSYYWWNDVMRRIILSEICPRMIKAGNTVRATQLANMASNRLLHLVNEVDGLGNKYSMRDYRYDESTHNDFDYSNHFFEMIDSLGVDNAIKYVTNVTNPVSKFDRFLNSRGYIDLNYLNDIVGTQCLRNMRYADAVKYLRKVNSSYYYHLNVKFHSDPFSTQKTRKKQSKRFKYDFAKEMHRLEQTMNNHKDPNIRAKAMFRYAIGMRNSFDFCWQLTQYYKGSGYWNKVCPKREWENEQLTKSALIKAENLTQLATKTATDTDVKADIQYALCNFRTVAEKYPNTNKGLLVRGACDNLYDHHIEKKPLHIFEKNPEIPY